MFYNRLLKIIKKLQAKKQSEPGEITEESSDVGDRMGHQVAQIP